MLNKSRFKGVIDTTLRDGQQSPLLFDSQKYRFTLEDKKALVNGLAQYGVRNFELFSPVVSKTEAADFRALKTYLQSIQKKPVKLLAHVRCDERDITQALAAGCDGLNLYIGLSERAQQNSHGLSSDEIIATAEKLLKQVKRDHPKLYMRFSAEDFFRTPIKQTFAVYDALSPYVQTLGMPDTVGVATPHDVTRGVKALRRRYPKHDIECHFHNDRGYALVNAVTAVLAGASYIDTSLWGLAERSGITSLTGLLLNLHQENPEYTRGFDISLSYPLNVLMASLLNMQVPVNEPVSLTNRTHTAGVHQKAILKDQSMYEAHNLAQFGVSKHQLLLGPLSGWNLIHYYLREVKQYDFDIEEVKKIAVEFKNQAQRIHADYSPDTLMTDIIAQHHLSAKTRPQVISGLPLENL